VKFISAVLVLCMLAPSVAAQEADEVCLPGAAHRLVLADLNELKLLRPRVTLLEQKLSIQAENVADLRAARDFAVQAKEESQAATRAQVRLTRKAREESPSARARWQSRCGAQVNCGETSSSVSRAACGSASTTRCDAR
jgi:hypothetical protein